MRPVCSVRTLSSGAARPPSPVASILGRKHFLPFWMVPECNRKCSLTICAQHSHIASRVECIVIWYFSNHLCRMSSMPPAESVFALAAVPLRSKWRGATCDYKRAGRAIIQMKMYGTVDRATFLSSRVSHNAFACTGWAATIRVFRVNVNSHKLYLSCDPLRPECI